MSMNLQKMGGVAALIEAFAYIIGFTVFIFVLDASAYEGPVRMIEFLQDHATVLYGVNLLIYVVFGVFLVVLTLALRERLQTDRPGLAQTSAAFGLIWAGLVIASGMIANIGMDSVIKLAVDDPQQASTVWLSISTLQEALGGGNEIVGGIWVLLVSWAGLSSGRLPKALNYLGLVVGAAGMLTTLPPLGELAAVFGLGQIVWFAWLGVFMLRH